MEPRFTLTALGEMLGRGELAGYWRVVGGEWGGLGSEVAVGKLVEGIKLVAGREGVVGVRNMAIEAAEVLLGEGSRELRVEEVVPLAEVVMGTGAREWPTEGEVLARIRGRIQAGGWRAVLAGLMVGPAHRWGLSAEGREAPELAAHWSRWVSYAPKLMVDEADAREMGEHTRRMVMGAGRMGVRGLELVSQLMTVPLYFEDRNERGVVEERGAMLREIADRAGYVRRWELSSRRKPGRIRVGVLAWNYAGRTETFTTYPVFGHLPEEEFEVMLFSAGEGKPMLPGKWGERVRVLPEKPAFALAMVRGAELDVVVHGTNLTARVHPLALLATCKLARKAVTFFSSPMTTGLAEVDAYVSGELTERVGAEADYTEKLIKLPGAGYCSGHREMDRVEIASPGRGRIGLPETGVVFASGAVVHKLSPGLRRAWAEILAGVPGSVLFLFPFAPTWDSQWPGLLVNQVMSAEFAAMGVDPKRLLLMDSLPSREHVVAVLKSADVYLDSFPYTGANSVLDGLEAGLPVVAMEGEQMRCRQAAAVLRSVGLGETVAGTAGGYVEIARRLGNDGAYRREVAGRVREAMAGKPACVDPMKYSAQVAEMFRRMVAGA